MGSKLPTVAVSFGLVSCSKRKKNWMGLICLGWSVRTTLISRNKRFWRLIRLILKNLQILTSFAGGWIGWLKYSNTCIISPMTMRKDWAKIIEGIKNLSISLFADYKTNSIPAKNPSRKPSILTLPRLIKRSLNFSLSSSNWNSPTRVNLTILTLICWKN